MRSGFLKNRKMLDEKNHNLTYILIILPIMLLVCCRMRAKDC